MKFYEFTQNNSGGSFVTSENLAYRLIIEAKSAEEANSIAEDLGCYFNGVDNGIDCRCCGDRWYESDEYDVIDLKKINSEQGGYEVYEWIEGKKGTHIEDVLIKNFKAKYPESKWLTEPTINNYYSSLKISGKIRMNNIEQYAQIKCDLYGCTNPDCRIFYANGTIKEISPRKC
jgi:hypothetical protein